MRTYIRLPSVLVIMGAIMAMTATLEVAVRYTDTLFTVGMIFVVIGITSWVIIQIYNYLRIIEARRIRAERAKLASGKDSAKFSLRGSGPRI